MMKKYTYKLITVVILFLLTISSLIFLIVSSLNDETIVEDIEDKPTWLVDEFYQEDLSTRVAQGYEADASFFEVSSQKGLFDFITSYDSKQEALIAMVPTLYLFNEYKDTEAISAMEELTPSTIDGYEGEFSNVYYHDDSIQYGLSVGDNNTLEIKEGNSINNSIVVANEILLSDDLELVDGVFNITNSIIITRNSFFDFVRHNENCSQLNIENSIIINVRYNGTSVDFGDEVNIENSIIVSDVVNNEDYGVTDDMEVETVIDNINNVYYDESMKFLYELI